MSISDEQSIENMQYIGGLFFRRLHEELSGPDRAALESWLDRQEPASRKFLEEMTDWEQIKTALGYLYQIDVPSALADVQKKIQLQDNALAPVAPGRTFRLWKRPYKYAAAAIVLAAVVGAAVFTLAKRKTNIAAMPEAQRFRNDVAPGGRKAILELADGSHIALDSAANGELVRQGVTRVMKQDDGQLSYETAASYKPQAASAVVYNIVSTPRGGQYRVVLPDGSKVWLNAASSLRFPTLFTGGERMVQLTGEAYFEVVKNAAMPFKVQVAPEPSGGHAPMQIEVLGTHFNIEAYADEQERRTTLVEGAVKVTTGNEQSVLAPGQQARLSTTGNNTLQVVSNVNTDEVTAWKNGLFQFREASIQSIMRQVSRWYDVDIVYQGKVNQQFFGKIPRNVQVSTLLKILESTGWVHFMIEGKKITVAP